MEDYQCEPDSLHWVLSICQVFMCPINRHAYIHTYGIQGSESAIGGLSDQIQTLNQIPCFPCPCGLYVPNVSTRSTFPADY